MAEVLMEQNIALYQAYLEELQEKYNIFSWRELNNKSMNDTASEACKKYLSYPHEFIEIIENDELIGFLIIGKKPNCHPLCDYYVCESYVKPEHRNKGYMSKVVKKYLWEHRGTYCLDVIRDNIKAKNFWFDRFIDTHYINLSLPLVLHGVEDLADTYFFEPEEMEK